MGKSSPDSNTDGSGRLRVFGCHGKILPPIPRCDHSGGSSCPCGRSPSKFKKKIQILSLYVCLSVCVCANFVPVSRQLKNAAICPPSGK